VDEGLETVSRTVRVTVTMTPFEADVLYKTAVEAEEDGRHEGGRARCALGRALDKLALARAAAREASP
jgi:hypothetical protein